ncbi:alpha/beta fold hydrolase [Dactylosporangium darangshiense]|uniref:Serine aminopeptidase S33 domain-containing protein n=1 Tax=Dactylosporangium darangshiense TaxID=579108 RepID=A0ABP8CZH4_9ACTN
MTAAPGRLEIAGTPLGGRPDRPLLLLGPSLGTTAEALWGECARRLGDRFHIVGWDLPGHGRSAPAPRGFGVAGLAAAVLDLAERIRPDEPVWYAGDSIGGAVGLQLLLDAPGRVPAAVLLCTGARIGEPAAWHARAAAVRAEGLGPLADGAAARWFSPGFAERDPGTAGALVAALRAADPGSYAQACEALAGFDARHRLAGIGAPVLAVAGADDAVTPPELLSQLARGVRRGRLHVLDRAAHQAPAERPGAVAALIAEHLGERGG